MLTLFYIHDPMCSWCYGFSHTLNTVLNGLPDTIVVKRLLGGLAPDNDEVMSDEMKRQIHSNWRRVEQSIPGVEFNHDFWTDCIPRRSTYPSCRAVIAARAQGDEYDVLMTEAIQNAYYRQARNPSEMSTLLELADELSLDVDRFKKDIASQQTQTVLRQEILQCAQLDASSFPSFRLQSGNDVWPITIDYHSAESMLESIGHLIRP